MSSRKSKKNRAKWSYDFTDRDDLSREEILARLGPLISQLRNVDRAVARIRAGEGTLQDVQALETILRQPIAIPAGASRKVPLVMPGNVASEVRSVCRALHFEAHAMPDRFPCYLLCRTGTDWDAPDTVLDELYLSARNDFFPDERFVVLMRGGRSRTFLRLSPLRPKLRRHLGGWPIAGKADDRECDDILETAAKLVLGAAWYEDQRLPFHVADVFSLAQFRAALEVMGFVLGSDLYKVSTAIRDDNETLIDFFENVYESEPLAALLRHLASGTMPHMANLEAKAREAFVKLNCGFSAFLSTAGPLRDMEKQQLYKVVLGCFFNLREVAARETWTPSIEQARETLEALSGECTRDVLAALDSSTA